MGNISAILVGVSNYPTLKCPSLPWCKNDLYVLKNALIKGLNATPDNILLCGESGLVTIAELVQSIASMMKKITSEDILIFYFSGHGNKNSLALSDGAIGLQELVDLIEQIPVKAKIAILDSCHSGSFELEETPKINVNDTVEYFVGRGYAVMASCGSEQTSGFNHARRISMYTSFLCDALTSRSLIRKGKKSLESINEAIFHFAKIANQKGNTSVQQPIFRSSIGGTIFFDVEEYNPYKVAEIYEETENYIIYDVKPLHNAIAKRISVKVILRFQSSMEEIAELSKEIKEKFLHCDVYQNESFEAKYKGKATNIVWCYFGYDEDDVVDGNYICHTTWVDENQNKEWWYRESKNTLSVNSVHIDINPSYLMIKGLKDKSVNREELIAETRECTVNMISIAEQYIKIYREYLNGILTEENLIVSLDSLHKPMSSWYFKQNNFPIPPVDLHEWANAHNRLTNAAHEFTLFYNKKHLHVWSTENRKWLMSNAIKEYEIALEELKSIDNI